MGKVIKKLLCPNCGFNLSYEEGKKGLIECPQCGHKVNVEDEKVNAEPKNYQVDDHSLSISFGGGTQQNPAALLVYLEDYLEKEREYVKNDFSEIGIPDLNEAIEQLKMTHGNEAEMWKLAFLSISEPTRIRLENLDGLVDEMIKSFEEKDEDKAYATFDTYVAGIKEFKKNEEQIMLDLERYLNRYIKMQGSSSDINDLKQKKDNLVKTFEGLPEAPEKLSDIKRLQEIKERLDNDIAAALLEKGIAADELYESALRDKQANNISSALHKFNTLGEYKDSPQMRKDLSRFSSLGDDLLIIAGKPFLALYHNPSLYEDGAKKKKVKKKKEDNDPNKETRAGTGFDLFGIKDGEPDYKNPLIKDYVKCLSIFGNLFYYISRNGRIHSYDLFKMVDRELEEDGHHYEKSFYLRYRNDLKGMLLSKTVIPKEKKVEKEPRFKTGVEQEVFPRNTNMCRLLRLNFGNNDNFVNVIVDRIAQVETFNDGEYLKNDFINVARYRYYKTKINRKEFSERTVKERILINVKTGKRYVNFIGEDEHFVTVIDNDVYFTRYANTKYNLSLIKKNLDTLQEELILTNAFHIVEIENNHVFYTIGNTDKEALCNYDMESKEKVLVFDRYNGFASHFGGFFYLYRGNWYNRTLFKIKEDGSTSMVLARNINISDGKFRQFKDGYFYYENIFGELCVVRIDGTKHKVIARGLEKVVKIEANTIYYSCQETIDKLYENENAKSGCKYRQALSIYKFNINQQGSDKILFAVDSWSYDGADTLYYLRLSDEEYRSSNMKKGRNFEVKTTIHQYGKMSLSSLEEESMFTTGLPHQQKERGCFILWLLFRRHADRDIEFKRLSWIRPYLTDKRADERRD